MDATSAILLGFVILCGTTTVVSIVAACAYMQHDARRRMRDDRAMTWIPIASASILGTIISVYALLAYIIFLAPHA